MSAVFQWPGAVLILVSFTLAQWERWSVLSYRYLWFNFLGGLALAVSAILGHQWGFVLLEGVWSVVAGRSLVVRIRGRERQTRSA